MTTINVAVELTLADEAQSLSEEAVRAWEARLERHLEAFELVTKADVVDIEYAVASDWSGPVRAGRG